MYQSRIKNAKKRTGRQERGRMLVEPDDSQSYAVVESMLGNGRLSALCEDGQTRIARIRGSMRKAGGKVIIEPRDLIVVALRDYEDDKADVIHKYTLDEVHEILKWNVLPAPLRKALTRSEFMAGDEDEEEHVVFGDSDNWMPTTSPSTSTAPSAGTSKKKPADTADDLDIAAI